MQRPAQGPGRDYRSCDHPTNPRASLVARDAASDYARTIPSRLRLRLRRVNRVSPHSSPIRRLEPRYRLAHTPATREVLPDFQLSQARLPGRFDPSQAALPAPAEPRGPLLRLSAKPGRKRKQKQGSQKSRQKKGWKPKFPTPKPDKRHTPGRDHKQQNKKKPKPKPKPKPGTGTPSLILVRSSILTQRSDELPGTRNGGARDKCRKLA